MLIRSQDKKTIINLNGIMMLSASDIKDEECYIGIRISEVCVYEIGKYSTETKAIKVLDMVQDAYKGYTEYCNLTDNQKQLMIDMATKEQYTRVTNSVYIMPQDSEVSE